jgi:hypothetical protein
MTGRDGQANTYGDASAGFVNGVIHQDHRVRQAGDAVVLHAKYWGRMAFNSALGGQRYNEVMAALLEVYRARLADAQRVLDENDRLLAQMKAPLTSAALAGVGPEKNKWERERRAARRRLGRLQREAKEPLAATAT